jgi:hypothetical protein
MTPSSVRPAAPPLASRRRSRPVLIAAALCTLTACSFMEFAWRYADEAVIGRVDHWLDLDGEQEQALTARVDPWLAATRREHLPRVAAFLRELATRTEQGFGLDDARWADVRFRELYRHTAAGMIEWLVPTLRTLDASQLEHLRARMDERNERYRDRYVAVDAEGRARALAERIIEQVERWTGPLERQQIALVRERARGLPDTAGDWHRYRMRMQDGLIALLQREAPADAVARHLRAWWIDFEPRPPRQVAATDALSAGIRRLLVELEAALTPAQRVGAVRRLRSLAEDLEALAAGAPSAAAGPLPAWTELAPKAVTLYPD